MTSTTEIACTILLLGAAGLATAEEAEPRPDAGPLEVVCRVNGSEILRRDVEAEKQNRLPYASYHGKVDESEHRTLRKEALQNLIDRELQYQDARKRGLGVSRKEVDREYERLVAKHPDKKTLKAQYERMGVSEKEVKASLERRLTVARAEREIAAAGGPASRADALRYYEARRDVFRLPRRAEVRQLLIKMRPLERSPDDWQQAVDMANTLRARLVEQEPFDSIVSEASQGPWKDRIEGTSIREVHPGQLEAALDQVLWELESGGVSQPVRAFKGVYLLKVDQYIESRQLPFDEIEDRLVKIVDAEHGRERQAAWLAALREAAEIEILDAELLPEGQDVSLKDRAT